MKTYNYVVTPKLNPDGTPYRVIRVGDIVRHFKGNLYKVVAFAKHTETGELLVIYRAMYPDKFGEYGTYARPQAMFLSEVDRDMYPDAEQQYRLEVVEIQSV